MKKNILLVVSIVLALFSLVGCSKDNKISKNNEDYEIDLGYYN